MTKENSTTAPENISPAESVLSAWDFSPTRTWVLAQNTFVQLVRMKVFYFLLVFVAIILALVGAGLFWQPLEHLTNVKRWSFGAMWVFSMVYSIAATSLLLPRDLEDRTLYTILSKPVPRFEYLLGRLIGVICVNAVSLGVMFTLMAILVTIQVPSVVEQFQFEMAQTAGGTELSQADLDKAEANALALGVTSSLMWALWALFLKACVISAITLFISTFASSSLFTIVMSASVVLIGHVYQVVLNYWEDMGTSNIWETILSKVLVVLFPNLAMFDVVDEVITGTQLATSAALKMTGLGLFYVLLATLLAQLIFIDKEL